ncbi:MAG: LytR family transcriptional regulator [Actinobacteria bacterium]|nr:LytR family transcriptional regulator [Actinomycetota bacterium]
MSQSEFQFIEPERPKRRRWIRYLLLLIAAIVTVAMVTLGGGVVYVSTQLRAAGIEVFSTDGETFDLPTAEEINGPINLLLIGSDTREGQGSTAYGPVGAELADVIILLHINEERSNAVAMSFPRDLMIAVPECPNPEGGAPYPAKEFAQINATMNYGGPACTLLEIPYLAMIDFKGVIAMSEAVGGVDVCVAEPIDDDYTQLYLDAGEHTLIGEEALAFLRTRHGVGDGSDLSRISNQQVFLTSLVRKLKDEGALTNPFTMFRLGTAALNNMTLSRSLTDLGVIYGMAREVNDVDLDKITFLKLPVYDLEGDFAGRVGVSTERATLLFDKLANDEPLVLAEPNIGPGAVVAEDSVPVEDAAEADVDVEQSTEAASESEDVLPDWVQGTNASVKSCSS